jgi:hypothetical protein
MKLFLDRGKPDAVRSQFPRKTDSSMEGSVRVEATYCFGTPHLVLASLYSLDDGFSVHGARYFVHNSVP